MIFYLDTSVLVAALTQEMKTLPVQRWLRGRESAEVAISEWVAAEFSAALSIKMRSGDIKPDKRTEALARFTRYSANSFLMLPFNSSYFRIAARFADQFPLGLRAGDALHLAIAAGSGVTLVTLDRRMAEAAAALGISADIL